MKDPFREGYPGWSEVVICVREFDQVQALETAGGWKRLHEGDGPPELRESWGLPAGARIRERLLHVPEMAHGYLRFVQITGLPQQLIRPPDARPWDTGGPWLEFFEVQG